MLFLVNHRTMEVDNAKTSTVDESSQGDAKLFTVKRWNPIALWTWDVECDTCAICRVNLMGKYFD